MCNVNYEIKLIKYSSTNPRMDTLFIVLHKMSITVITLWLILISVITLWLILISDVYHCDYIMANTN